MDIKVTIEAPELVAALEKLAGSLNSHQVHADPEAIGEAAVKPAASEKPKEEKKAKADKPAKEEPKKEEPARQEDPPAEKEAADTPKISKEVVRAKLAALTQEGKQAEVKELFAQFDAKKLSEIPEEKYQELLTAAEGL